MNAVNGAIEPTMAAISAAAGGLLHHVPVAVHALYASQPAAGMARTANTLAYSDQNDGFGLLAVLAASHQKGPPSKTPINTLNQLTRAAYHQTSRSYSAELELEAGLVARAPSV